MEELVKLVALGGDSAILIGIAGIGYHKVTVRLTAIESALRAKREIKRAQDDGVC